MWQPCLVKGCDANNRNFGYDGGNAHGVEHGLIDDNWMTPPDLCFVQSGWDLPNAAGFVSDGKPGRYLVDHDFGDGTELILSLVKESADA